MEKSGFVPVEIEYNPNYYNGDCDNGSSSAAIVYLSLEQLGDENCVLDAFHKATGHDPARIVSWRIMEESEEAEAKQLYLSGLVDDMVRPDDTGEDDSINGRFQSFHAANPKVAYMLTQMALQLQHNGVKRWGIKALYEALRYQVLIATGKDGFRLNNDYTSRYARLIMDTEPALTGFFSTRMLRS